MIIENLINSVLNFTPEIILFLMSMVVLITGVFKPTKNYVVSCNHFLSNICNNLLRVFLPRNSFII